MAKDTFYFSHDYNSRNDEKIKSLIFKHGLRGYGIFWAIIEELYNNANELQTNYERIAFELREDLIIVKSVIEDFELFVISANYFGSMSVKKRLEERANKSKKASDSVNKRWEQQRLKELEDTNVLPPNNDSNTIKERKGNKSKVKDSKFIPEFLEFLDYVKTLEIYKPTLDYSIKAKYESWIGNNWKDGNDNEISNWKTKIQNTLPHLKPVIQENKQDLSLAHSREFKL